MVRFDVVGPLSCLRRPRLHPATIWAPIRWVEPWRGVNAPSGGDGSRRGSGAGAGRGGRFRRPAGHGHRGACRMRPSRRRGSGCAPRCGRGVLHAGEKIVEPGAEPSAQDGVGVRPSHSLGIWRPRGRSIRLGRGTRSTWASFRWTGRAAGGGHAFACAICAWRLRLISSAPPTAIRCPWDDVRLLAL